MKERGKIEMLMHVGMAAAVFAAAAGLLVYAQPAAEAGKQAVRICLELLIPSLFPFFMVSGLILSCGYADAASKWFAPMMRGLFGVGGACAPAFLLGLVGGYPVGARTAITLYRQGSCTREEAERLLAFCNNSGPAFVLGLVGTGILGSAKAGLLLYAAHIAASVCVGILFRFWKGEKSRIVQAEKKETALQRSFLECFLDSVKTAGAGVASISLFVVFFAVMIAMLLHSGILTAAAEILGHFFAPLGLDAETAEKLLMGFLEVTAGLQSLAEVSLTLTEKMAAASCMLGWAGLCVHCQVLSFLQGSGLSARPYLLGKLTQGTLAMVWIRLFLKLFPAGQAQETLLEMRLERLAGADGIATLLTTLTGALAVMLFMAMCAQYGKTRRKR